MQIIFTTFNARYSHTALALRCLRANLGALRDQSEIIEFDNRLSPQTAAEKLLASHPDLLLFSVYIWNLTVISETVAILRTLRPELKIIIGGPEVCYEYEDLSLFKNADHLICGESESIIEEVCRTLLQGRQDACDTVPQQGRQDACDTVPQQGRQDACDTVPQASSLPSFNPLQPVQQSRRKNLPHWTQEHCTYFVTFRLADSIAHSRINEYKELREKWKEHHHPPYTENEKEQFDELFSERVNGWLDEGAGACILKKPDISKFVAATLTHFDGERYDLDEWVIMPNHVHVLVTPKPGFDLTAILHSWKSYSAQQINKHLGNTGTIWKRESYDHIVRNQEELACIRKYIRNNPVKAGVTALQGRQDACGTQPQQGRQDACDTVPQQGRQDACGTVPQASSLPKVIEAPPADLGAIALPYDEYTDEDIAHRRIYVETSRGCPAKCQYCLSALENGIRFFPLETLFPMFGKLIERGARTFKFIDRSFNANTAHAAAILRFFLTNRCDGMMLHLEWEPHRLPEKLKQLLAEAPDGFFQLEVGVQTFTPEVAARIDRKLDEKTVAANIRTLSAMPSIHLHADLIAGLPGETLESLSAGFDRLHACGPHEIQLGILKKLRGAPIAQHDGEFEMFYHTAPPYDVLQTSTMSFPELQAVRRFARFWDITVNNGRFPNSAPLIWKNQPSVFGAFMDWSDWLYEETHATAGFTPGRLGRLLNRFLTEEQGLNSSDVRRAIEQDLDSPAAGTKGMERQTRGKK